MNRRALLCCLLVLLVPAVGLAQRKRPMTVDDLFKFKRLSDPQISPDGRFVAYVVGTADLAGNKTSSSIWLAPTDGGEPRPLTNTTKKDRSPRWSPDGKQVLFESSRSGDGQLWIIDVAGGEARQVTNLSTEASSPTWSPDGKSIAFVSAVYPDFSDKPFKESNEANKKKKEEIEKSPVKAKVFTRLFYRHWDSWVEDKRQHLFVIAAPTSSTPIPEPKDVTPGDRDAYPTSTTFSSSVDFTFSPDSKYLVFTAPPERDEAWSTAYDILRVPVSGGTVETLTRDNKAADSGPQFSPDGKHLAFRSQRKPGYEADKWELLVVAVDPSGAWKGKPRSLTRELDRSVEEFIWTGADSLLFSAEDGAAQCRVLSVKLNETPQKLNLGDVSGTLRSFSQAGGKIAFSVAKMQHPPEVYVSHGRQGGQRQPGQHGPAHPDRHGQAGERDGQGRGGRHADVDPQAAGLRSEQEMAGGLHGSRRPAGGVGGRLELPLVPGVVGGPGLRHRPAQSARQHRLRPEVHRRHQRRLGRQVLRRPHERRRLRGETALRR